MPPKTGKVEHDRANDIGDNHNDHGNRYTAKIALTDVDESTCEINRDIRVVGEVERGSAAGKQHRQCDDKGLDFEFRDESAVDHSDAETECNRAERRHPNPMLAE